MVVKRSRLIAPAPFPIFFYCALHPEIDFLRTLPHLHSSCGQAPMLSVLLSLARKLTGISSLLFPRQFDQSRFLWPSSLMQLLFYIVFVALQLRQLSSAGKDNMFVNIITSLPIKAIKIVSLLLCFVNITSQNLFLFSFFVVYHELVFQGLNHSLHLLESFLLLVLVLFVL